ncbi:outer membrane beta-barrel protein [Nitratireductor sp. CAU 1489]|uniref:Outer membrane beta-barrel protein n=2 Tax=Alphaproteobacteria TaxID=28211 RepID=A0A844QCT1_9HYPH|nr:outer membrane protein [Nitratireductor arenosus]MVA95639.1 outer membrane beta-barrel protein [Nitratireductor arenosus]
MHIRSLIPATAFLCASSSTALAADPIDPDRFREPVVEAATFDWTGLYVGAHAGVGASSTTWSFSPFGNAVQPNPFRGGGGFGGLQLGYNFQSGNWVIGAEGDIALANIEGSSACPLAPFSCESAVKWLGSARLRVGYAFDRTLIYGTGGAGFGSVLREFVHPVFGTGISSDKTQVGWTAGAGVEFAVNEAWSIKGEYLYYDLGRDTYVDTAFQSSNIRTTLHTAKIGINFHW